jgi:hypothetical protein
MNFQDIFQAVEVQSISAKNGNLKPVGSLHRTKEPRNLCKGM